MATSADLATTLLNRAAGDELAAKSLLPVEGVTNDLLGFHAQQAIEKSMKAVLALRGVEFPYTHDLDELLEVCRENSIDVPDDLSAVGSLSPFAGRLRYDATPAAHLDREQGLSWAAAAVGWARTTIDQAVQVQAADPEPDRTRQPPS